MNPSYSLRAFARDLKMTPQMLSFVLNEKKGISHERAADVADRLELNPVEANYFVDLVALAHSTSPQARRLAQYRVNERLATSEAFRSLDLAAFETISGWQHYAILELTGTDSFQNDPKWIASRLGISPFEVSEAMGRLQRLGLLDVNDVGRIMKTSRNLTATYDTPTSALRKLARQFLEKAMHALDTQSMEERDITNITMAVDPARVPEAKEMITEFRRKLCAFLEEGKQTEVYTFAPALFRISQNTSKDAKNLIKKRSP